MSGTLAPFPHGGRRWNLTVVDLQFSERCLAGGRWIVRCGEGGATVRDLDTVDGDVAEVSEEAVEVAVAVVVA